MLLLLLFQKIWNSTPSYRNEEMRAISLHSDPQYKIGLHHSEIKLVPVPLDSVTKFEIVHLIPIEANEFRLKIQNRYICSAYEHEHRNEILKVRPCQNGSRYRIKFHNDMVRINRGNLCLSVHENEIVEITCGSNHLEHLNEKNRNNYIWQFNEVRKQSEIDGWDEKQHYIDLPTTRHFN